MNMIQKFAADAIREHPEAAAREVLFSTDKATLDNLRRAVADAEGVPDGL